MGILSKRNVDFAPDKPEPDKAARPTDPATLADPLGPAGCSGPCPVCRCNVAWWNIYDGGPFCAECQPPTVAAMVKSKQFIFGEPGKWYFDDPPEKPGSRPKNVISGNGEISWAIERDGRQVTITAEPGRIDPSRTRGAGGRWNPPLAAGLVGDLTADEDWQHWQAIQHTLARFQ